MRVLILGDIHGKFKSADAHYEAIIQAHKEPDLMIVVGDMGFWPQTSKPWTRTFNHPCVFVDGNHEDHWTLRAMTRGDADWGIVGGPSKGWKDMMDSWEYMPRGTIRDGILYIGGARSINTRHAIRGVNWFPEENISHEEQQFIYDEIVSYGPDNIHTMITHDAPAVFDVSEGCTQTGREIVDGNRKFLDSVRQMVRPTYWFFGHYHYKLKGNVAGTKFRCIDMVRDNCDTNDYVFIEL